MGVVLPADGFLAGAARPVRPATACCSIFDEVISGFRAAAGGAQQIWQGEARPDVPRQDHRRRPAGRRLRRARGPDGVRVAGRARSTRRARSRATRWRWPPGSGRSRRCSKPLYATWRASAAMLAVGLADAARDAGVAAAGQRARLAAHAVLHRARRCATTARRSRPTACSTRAFFRGMLARGIYPPPSQFEAWFLSAAHTEADVKKTIRAAAGGHEGSRSGRVTIGSAAGRHEAASHRWRARRQRSRSAAARRSSSSRCAIPTRPTWTSTVEAVRRARAGRVGDCCASP